MCKVLNCACKSPPIDDFVRYELCEPINVISFPIMASILQLTHEHS